MGIFFKKRKSAAAGGRGIRILVASEGVCMRPRDAPFAYLEKGHAIFLTHGLSTTAEESTALQVVAPTNGQLVAGVGGVGEVRRR